MLSAMDSDVAAALPRKWRVLLVVWSSRSQGRESWERRWWRPFSLGVVCGDEGNV
jgi:hypothetical protein